MRTAIAIACLFIAPLAGYSQVKSIARFYEKYQHEEKVLDVKIQGWLLKLAAKFADEAETHNVLRKVTYLRAIVMEQGNLVKAGEYRNLINSLHDESFEPLIKVRDGKDKVDLLIRENKGLITDALVIIYGQENFILLSIEGKLQFSDLNDLEFDIDGSEYFKQLPEYKGDLPKA